MYGHPPVVPIDPRDYNEVWPLIFQNVRVETFRFGYRFD